MCFRNIQETCLTSINQTRAKLWLKEDIAGSGQKVSSSLSARDAPDNDTDVPLQVRIFEYKDMLSIGSSKRLAGAYLDLTCEAASLLSLVFKYIYLISRWYTSRKTISDRWWPHLLTKHN